MKCKNCGGKLITGINGFVHTPYVWNRGCKNPEPEKKEFVRFPTSEGFIVIKKPEKEAKK